MTQSKRLEERLRETYERSRDIVRIAHERAERANARAAQMRGALRHRTEELAHLKGPHWKAVSLLQLAVDEAVRSVQEKDRFLAVVVHELRQPLNAALAALSVLNTSEGDRARRAREVIERQLHQMARLTEDLLDTSRLALKSMDLRNECVELRRVVQHACDSIEALASERGLTTEIQAPAASVCVWGDEMRLRQVFSNLLSNAVRYTAAGGRVRLSSEVRGERILVAIDDTGRGIAPEDVTRIFEPFARGVRDGAGGFGIGLFLVRGIVELHGGTVGVASAGIGNGSRFTVELPVCPRHQHGDA
jgi:signal transduction histidine kinase